MGKLNVVAPAVNVTVGGVEYRKVDRAAQEGDIVRIMDADVSHISNGGFYEVDRIDSCGDAQITDNDGDSYDTYEDTLEVYEKVTQETKGSTRLTVGDYARVIGKNVNSHNYVVGSVIKIVVDDRAGNPYKGERADGTIGNWLPIDNVVRATEAEFLARKPAPKPESTSVKVGDRMRIVAANMTAGKYRNGDELTVESIVMASGDAHVFAEGIGIIIGSSEYVVIPPAPTPAPQIDVITHEGHTYKKVARKAGVGDLVVITANTNDHCYSTGGIVKAAGRYDQRSGYNDKAVGIKTASSTGHVRDSDYLVLEPVSETEVKRHARVGERIRIAKACDSRYSNGAEFTVTGSDLVGVHVDSPLGHNNGRMGIFHSEYVVLEPVTPPARLKVGEYAKVIKATPSFSTVGLIVKVTDDDASSAPFDTEGLDGNYTGWHGENALVRATDEEVAEARAALDPRNQFAKGDKVRLVAKAGRLNGYDVGSIYTVAEPKPSYEEDLVKITGGAVPQGYAITSALVKVSAEEIERDALTAKWAAIGRKVNEYKNGDIVRFTESTGASSYPSGSLAEIYDVEDDMFNFGGSFGGTTNWCELVTPVEQRFDR